MLSRSTLLHLRLPFSFILLPAYLFALSAAPAIVPWKALLVFFVLHFLVYPASNAFNSYYDRDKDSIGTLKHPPPVERELLPVALVLDGLAVALGLFIDWVFALAVLVYGLCSKAYSWDKTRLKRQPVWGLVGAALVSGALGFLMSWYGVQAAAPAAALGPRPLWAALCAALFHLSSFPLTQVYQHKEDRERGDRTLSLVLGVRGTFVFSGLGLAVSLGGVFVYCLHYHGWAAAAAFAACLAGPAAYFTYWSASAWRNPTKADYDRSMRLTLLAAGALNVFFLGLTLIERIIAPVA